MSPSASVSHSAGVRWEAPFSSEDLFCSVHVWFLLEGSAAAATVQLVSGVNSVLEF